jgi:hypothetical protein
MKGLLRALAIACNVAVSTWVMGLFPADPGTSYALISALVAVVGSLAAAGASYASAESAQDSSEAQLARMFDRDALLGSSGLYFGSDNIGQLKGLWNDLLSSDGMHFLDSEEYANRLQFAQKLSPEEKSLIQQAISAGGQAPPEETALRNFIAAQLRGDFLPGGPNTNPALQGVIDRITRQSQEQAGLAGERFASEASNVLGGLSGAGSFLPEYQRLQRGFQTEASDSVNSVIYDLWNQGVGNQIQSAGLAPAAMNAPFERLRSTFGFASIPRQIKDTAIQRALGAFTDRANRMVQIATGAGGLINSGSLSSAAGAINVPQSSSASAILGGIGGAAQQVAALLANNRGYEQTQTLLRDILGGTTAGTPGASTYNINVGAPTPSGSYLDPTGSMTSLGGLRPTPSAGVLGGVGAYDYSSPFSGRSGSSPGDYVYNF